MLAKKNPNSVNTGAWKPLKRASKGRKTGGMILDQSECCNGASQSEFKTGGSNRSYKLHLRVFDTVI